MAYGRIPLNEELTLLQLQQRHPLAELLLLLLMLSVSLDVLELKKNMSVSLGIN